ncbi:MAG: hypothetical protein J7K40_13840 [candidate division Zixibacteria bacterium]|nr:hypothetical protein [candidate division Zixibacteria bacterium]
MDLAHALTWSFEIEYLDFVNIEHPVEFKESIETTSCNSGAYNRYSHFN